MAGKKNLYFAINNVIRLEEARVRPEDIQNTDRDMLLFVEMWKKLESVDVSIYNFRKRLIELQDVDVFNDAVNKIFKFHGKKSDCMEWLSVSNSDTAVCF